jgi:hypothetical protein
MNLATNDNWWNPPLATHWRMLTRELTNSTSLADYPWNPLGHHHDFVLSQDRSANLEARIRVPIKRQRRRHKKLPVARLRLIARA